MENAHLPDGEIGGKKEPHMSWGVLNIFGKIDHKYKTEDSPPPKKKKNKKKIATQVRKLVKGKMSDMDQSNEGGSVKTHEKIGGIR